MLSPITKMVAGGGGGGTIGAVARQFLGAQGVAEHRQSASAQARTQAKNLRLRNPTRVNKLVIFSMG